MWMWMSWRDEGWVFCVLTMVLHTCEGKRVDCFSGSSHDVRTNLPSSTRVSALYYAIIEPSIVDAIASNRGRLVLISRCLKLMVRSREHGRAHLMVIWLGCDCLRRKDKFP